MEPLLHYIFLVVDIAMLKCSTAILKAQKTLKVLFTVYIYTSSETVTIPKELSKTHVKSVIFFCQ